MRLTKHSSSLHHPLLPAPLLPLLLLCLIHYHPLVILLFVIIFISFAYLNICNDRILTMLASVSGAESVLELGTFTGYSALCFAEGIAKGRRKNRGVSKEVVDEVVDEVVVEDELEAGIISLQVMYSDIIANVEHINDKNDSDDRDMNSLPSEKKTRQDVKDEKRMKINEKIKEMQKNIISSKIAKIEINERATFTSRRSEENSLKRQKISAKIEEKKNEIEKARQSRLEIQLNTEKELIGDNENHQKEMANSDDKGVRKGDEKRERRGSVVTCEVDPSAAEIALDHFQKSEYKDEVCKLHLLHFFAFFLLEFIFYC